MQYHPDDLLRIQVQVEEQGGALAPGRCEASKFRLKLPSSGDKFKYRDLYTTGCGRESRFLVTYKKPDREDEEGGIIEGGIGTAAVCAHDDDMGRWPRFQEAVQEDSN